MAEPKKEFVNLVPPGEVRIAGYGVFNSRYQLISKLSVHPRFKGYSTKAGELIRQVWIYEDGTRRFWRLRHANSNYKNSIINSQ